MVPSIKKKIILWNPLRDLYWRCSWAKKGSALFGTSTVMGVFDVLMSHIICIQA